MKESNFNSCSFRVTLPELIIEEGAVLLKFQVQSKPGICVDVSLNEAYLSDKLKRIYEHYYNDACKPKEQSRKFFLVHIPIDGKNFLKSDSTLILFFLAGDRRKYEICFNYRASGSVLEYVMTNQITDKELKRLEENIRKTKDSDSRTQQSDKGFTIGKETGGQGGTAGGQEIRIPKIEEYKKALLREKFFLQNEGGRKHKLTNGRLINHKNGLSTYSFEMESELNLSDDAPISLSVGTNEATGSVLVCEGFQIIVVVDRDYGTRVSQALLGVEPWKLLEALVNKLDMLRSNHILALKLLNEGPGLATSIPSAEIPKGQNTAISMARQNSITVIWGPPGTGKTYTMSEIARESLQSGKSVLVVSHSNVSVDGVVKQTVAGLRNAGMGKLLEEGKVLRYGYVRDEDLSRDSFAVAYNYVLLKQPDLQKRIEKSYKEKDQLKIRGIYHSARGEQIERELKQLRSQVRLEEKSYVEKAMLVATTISKVTVDSLFEDRDFDVVMFDEVSMAYVPQIVCAAMHAREKLVLVGDFRQLAPIVQSDAKSVLSVDVFSFLAIAGRSRVCAHPWLVMLNEQRRMHPAISAFPNNKIYDHLLIDHNSVKTNRLAIVNRNPFSGYPINLIDLTGSYCAAMKNSDNSRFNVLSAIISFATAIDAEKNGEKSIGIITPYAAQTRLIRAMIQDYRKDERTEVACSTVHQFQGSERNIILFDAVESYPASKVGWLMGKDFDSVSRLINVAVTRARGKLVVVGNALFWENKFKPTDHIFYNLIRYLQRLGNVISTENNSLTPYIQNLPSTKNIRFYQQIGDVIEQFGKDIAGAKERIVISIPDGKLDGETQGTILNHIMIAKAKGIMILCKAKGYEDLPESWKKITWTSENAVFPVIMIDDRVIWYSLPKSRFMFTDGNTGFYTGCQTIYRITGEHTLEMIKTFSDLEYKVVDGQRKPLTEKAPTVGSTPVYDGGSRSGLDAFVRQMEKCPKCKSPMMLTRSRQGKCYLKCSSPNCNEIAYLTKDFTNWYIERNRVCCPVHKSSEIHAGLGKYGIYIRCQQGHYLKPDEI